MKRAVLIGINYLRSPENRLAGCANDVRNMKAFVTELGFESRVLCDDPGSDGDTAWPSRRNILDAIAWSLRGMCAGDEVLVHYSGHGGLTVDASGDEESGYDSCLYPVNEEGAIECFTDDELRVALVDKVPDGARCTVVFDCCHSGTCLDLRYGYRPISESEMVVKENARYAKSRAQVVFLSGCADDQTAADTVDDRRVPTGALTNALMAVLRNERKMKRVLWAIRKELIARGYSQLPQMSSSLPLGMSDPLFAW
jgi:uncharacterized caspase-like protein